MLDVLKPRSVALLRAREAILAAAEAAEGFAIPEVLSSYQQESGCDAATAEWRRRELFRFLLVLGHLPHRGYGMYGPVDGLWHCFVLHTERYQVFCETYAAGFVHHHPGSSAKGAGWRSRYLQFLIDYRVIFGAPPPDDVWPVPNVPKAKLPSTTAELRPRHVRAMERMERGVGGPDRQSQSGVALGDSNSAPGCFGGGEGVDGDGGCGGGGG
ncbi:hypothetical protein [Pelagibius sp.]|uniref:hypothetical protein n=1 Tax=Pelagibius sp. TaxID=1931238 RepID=UPI003BAF4A10